MQFKALIWHPDTFDHTSIITWSTSLNSKFNYMYLHMELHVLRTVSLD